MTSAIKQKTLRCNIHFSLRRRITRFFVTLFVILAFTSCESTPRKKALTVEDERVVAEFGRNFHDFDGFRFYVSQRITLVQVGRTLEADDELTIVTDERGKGRILLKKNTEGRHQPNYRPHLNHRDYPKNARWVAFDWEGEGEPLPIAFAPGRPNDDKYYLFSHWIDPRTGLLVTSPNAGQTDKYIIYNNFLYRVDYMGKDPPHLLYNIVGEKKSHTQIMRGLP